MREINVAEHGKFRFLALDRNQRDMLLSVGGQFSLHPEPGTEDLWCLQAGSHIGTVVLPGMTLRVRPKLDISRLFVMLSSTSDSIRWLKDASRFSESSQIEDVVAMALAESIRYGRATGLLRGFVAIEEESFVVRGKLNIAETIRRHPMLRGPVVQTPEFLDENIHENRVLATALSRIARRTASPLVRKSVVDCQQSFAGVDIISEGTAIPLIRRNRLNSRWWGAIELALLVLSSCGFDLPSGVYSGRSFLVDMNVVFERFVYRKLAEALRPFGYLLQYNRSGLHLDSDAIHGLRPDLSIWTGTKCLFVGDCKYKCSDDAVARREDLYQCLAYAAATGLSRVTLVYGASNRAIRDVQVVNGCTTIKVRPIDLSASSDALHAQFASLARELAGDVENLRR